MVEGRMLEEDANMRSGIGLKATAGAVLGPLFIVSLVITSRLSNAEDTAASAAAATSSPADAPGKAPPAPPKLPEPKGARRLSKDYPIWIDPKEKTVIVEGQVS